MKVNYEMVDLGLPSGLKWAKCNLGAEKEEEYGEYFMWGSTKSNTNDECNWVNTPYQSNKELVDGEILNPKFTKYLGSTCDSQYKDENATDIDVLKKVLDPMDDAVTVNMGNNWRMPTSSECYELENNTIKTFEKINGVNGYKYTNKTDTTKYIFIPTSGFRVDSFFYLRGLRSSIWASTIESTYPKASACFGFGCACNSRSCGMPIRAVCK